MHEFISRFAFGGLVSIGIGSAKAKDAVYRTIDKLPPLPEGADVFFGPAMRKTPGDTKEDVLGSVALWVDVDNEHKPRWTLPPTYAVFSGHGWHCYWFLTAPCLQIEAIEEANKLLAEDTGADMGCWNVNRVLRVPGTTNHKEQEPVKVELRYSHDSVAYELSDFQILRHLSKQGRHKVATGDSRGYRTRSERDWAILTELVKVGASDSLILKLFEYQPCGDKHRESGSDAYLKHSIERIREKAQNETPEVEEQVERAAIVERPDGYYVPFRKGLRRVSTFVLQPKILLDGSPFDTEDSLVCNVAHDDYLWEDKVFPRDAFNSVSKMAKMLPVAAWQWLGRDDDVKELLPYLIERLKEGGLPRVAATKTMGLHSVRGRWLFLGDQQVLSASDVWQGFQGPLAWMTSKTEHPKLSLCLDGEPDLKAVGELVPQLNEDVAIWPMIGWYTSCMLKPWIEAQGYRFPILNVAGTRGSGKTTLIQRVFMPMWGQENPNTYDSGTTRFVTLALLGSSNAVPIAFSEFRVDAVQRFLRFVLLAYDTGHDARGKADQTTQDYPLQAPFSLDGEDLIDDAAARERIVVAKLHPQAIEEGSGPYKAYKSIGRMPSVGGHLISRVLQRESEWPEMLMDARSRVFEAFPGKLPDRVRNNHIIDMFGILLWCSITDTEVPSALVLEESILSVFNMKAGRSRTLCDDMIEHVINSASNRTARFKYDVSDGVFWFQLTPAYDEWVIMRRRQNRGTLEKDAMKTQISEAPYHATPRLQKGVWMEGIDLMKASEAGLDVPSEMNVLKVTLNI